MEDSVQAVNIETGPITPFHQPSQQGGTSGENFTTPMNSSIELNIDPMPSTRGKNLHLVPGKTITLLPVVHRWDTFHCMPSTCNAYHCIGGRPTLYLSHT